jgi:hypothetical protein
VSAPVSAPAGGGEVRRPRPVGYRPSAIKAPATIARRAMSVPSPEKLRLKSGISPVKMSQIPNNSMPRFLVNFIGRLLSTIELRIK